MARELGMQVGMWKCRQGGRDVCRDGGREVELGVRDVGWEVGMQGGREGKQICRSCFKSYDDKVPCIVFFAVLDD